MTISGMASGSVQEAPFRATAKLTVGESGSLMRTSDPVKMEGSFATSSAAVVGSCGRFANCLPASSTSCSCSTAPAAATTYERDTKEAIDRAHLLFVALYWIFHAVQWMICLVSFCNQFPTWFRGMMCLVSFSIVSHMQFRDFKPGVVQYWIFKAVMG